LTLNNDELHALNNLALFSQVLELNAGREAKIEEVQNNQTVLQRIFELTPSNFFDGYFAKYPAEKVCGKNNKLAK
jgi:hypothetical protein